MKSQCYWGHVLDGLGWLKDRGYSPRCCITSPPYYALRDYQTDPITWPDGTSSELGLEETPELYIDHLATIFSAVKEILSEDGTIFIVIGDSFAGSGGPGSQYAESKKGTFKKFRNPSRKLEGHKNKDMITIPWMLGQALKKDGWYLRCDVIWNKTTFRPNPVKDRSSLCHEYVLFVSKNRKYFYDYDAVKETEIKRSVWSVAPATGSKNHWAEFPIELPLRCILAGSEIQDFVLDPFMGSGTTAEAAEILGRKWIGCELDRANEKLLFQRLESVQKENERVLF